MRNGETLKAYSGRYWEMYNEMDGNFDDVAINTFKSSLPAKHGQRPQLPLKFVLRTADYTRRIALWNTILGVFDVKYMPRTSIKGQVLADLVAEFAEPPIETPFELHVMEGKPIGMASTPKPPCWKVYVDGAANQRGSGVGLVLITPEGATTEKSLRLGFSTTNNEAKYEALMQGIAMVQKMGGEAVEMFSNLRLVVG